MKEIDLRVLKDSLQKVHKEYSAKRIKMYEEMFEKDEGNGELILEMLGIVKRHVNDDEYTSFIKYLNKNGLQVMLSKSNYNQLIFINRVLYKLVVDLYYNKYLKSNNLHIDRLVANFISKLDEVDGWINIFVKELLPVLLILKAFDYLKGGKDERDSRNKK